MLYITLDSVFAAFVIYLCVCSETATSDICLFLKSYKVDLLFTGPVGVFPIDDCSLSSSCGVHLVLPDIQGFVLFRFFLKQVPPNLSI